MKRTPMPRSRKPLARRTRLRQRSKRRNQEDRLDAQWREKVLGRWGRKCMLKNFSESLCYGILHVHHLYGRQAHPKLRREPLNGLVVCSRHHVDVHSMQSQWRECILANLLTPEERERLEQMVREQ